MSEVRQDRINENQKQIEDLFSEFNIRYSSELHSSVRSLFLYYIDENNMTVNQYELKKRYMLNSGWRYIGKKNHADIFCDIDNVLLEVNFPSKDSVLKDGKISVQKKNEWAIAIFKRLGGVEDCKENKIFN